MEKVIVIGASRFIDRHSLKPLIEKGFKVHAITSKTPTNIIDLRFREVVSKIAESTKRRT